MDFDDSTVNYIKSSPGAILDVDFDFASDKVYTPEDELPEFNHRVVHIVDKPQMVGL